MCNAWNHPGGCTCGWGGEGHLGGGYGTAGPGFSLGNLRVHYESFVNPNARCPVCGDPVFFYQSPYGGRVFFDELGIPWPKHPCTDSGRSIDRIDFERMVTSDVGLTRRWESEGWRPFTVWHFTGEKLFGTYADYVNKIEERSFMRFGKPEPYYASTEDLPFIALRLREGQNLFQRRTCVFFIYPTFIRASKRGEQFFDLSTFILEKNEIRPILVSEAYMPRIHVGDTIKAHTRFKFDKKTGTLVLGGHPHCYF